MEKRQRIKVEILTTEKTYLGTLEKLQLHFVKPLQEGRILTRPQLNEIFSNLQDIMKVNTELYAQLEERIGPISTLSDDDNEEELQRDNNVTLEDKDLADIFINMSPFLKIYAVYAKNYTNALTRVSELMRKNSEFGSFLSNALKQADCQGLTFEAFILTPIQRIPRYKLLLQDLLKNTPKTHSDHKKLPQALESIEQVALFLNDTIRKHEIILQMLRLQKQISGFPEDLIVPGRMLVKQGIVTKVCRKSVKLRALFLFSDMLLYASVSTYPTSSYVQDGSYTFHRKFALDDLRVIEDGSSFGSAIKISATVGDVLQMTSSDSASEDLIFQVKTPQKSFALICSSVEEKRAWINTINDTVQAYKSNKSTLRLDIVKSRETATFTTSCSNTATKTSSFDDEHYDAPVWIPDNATKNCMECQNEFTLLRRRHHCRSCGRVLCSQCTSRRTMLPSQYEIPTSPKNASSTRIISKFSASAANGQAVVRVCDNCYVILEAKLMKLKKELLQSSVNEMERPISELTTVEDVSLHSAVGCDAAVQVLTARQNLYKQYKEDAENMFESDSDDECPCSSLPIGTASASMPRRFNNDLASNRNSQVSFSWSQRIKSIYTPSSPSSYADLRGRRNRFSQPDGESPRSAHFFDLHNSSRPESLHSTMKGDNCGVNARIRGEDEDEITSSVGDNSGAAVVENVRNKMAGLINNFAERTTETVKSTVGRVSRSQSLSDMFTDEATNIPQAPLSRRQSLAGFVEEGFASAVSSGGTRICTNFTTPLSSPGGKLTGGGEISPAEKSSPLGFFSDRKIPKFPHIPQSLKGKSLISSMAEKCHLNSGNRRCGSDGDDLRAREDGQMVLKIGYMMKRGKKFKSWKVRLMVLTATELQWYKPEAAPFIREGEKIFLYANSNNENMHPSNNGGNNGGGDKETGTTVLHQYFMNSIRLDVCTEVAYAIPTEIDLDHTLEKYSQQPQLGLYDFPIFDVSRAKFPLKLISPQRSLYMITTSDEDRDDWILLLTRKVRDALNKSNGLDFSDSDHSRIVIQHSEHPQPPQEQIRNNSSSPPVVRMSSPPRTPLPSPPQSPPHLPVYLDTPVMAEDDFTLPSPQSAESQLESPELQNQIKEEEGEEL